MVDPHGRYEQLAVGHVLGGLGMSEAADFRSHLLGCPACRTRVAELRDIATDLEAAEREERQRSVVQTELPRRTEPTEGQEVRGTEGRVAIRHVTLAVVVVMLLAGAMAFWNLHLRSNVTLEAAAADQHADTLRELASGVVVPATLGGGVSGLVVLGNDVVAFSLSGVEDVGSGDRLVAWLLGAAGEATSDSALLARPGALDEGLLTGVLPVGGAVELVVSRESGDLGAEPEGEILLRADLVPDGP